MNKDKLNALGVFLISCPIHLWLYSNYLYDPIVGRLWRYIPLPQYPIVSSIFCILFVLAAAMLTSLLYWQISHKQFQRWFVWSFFLVYIPVVLFLLLGRRIVFRGVELNPLAFISYFRVPGGSFKNIVNIILLFPLGNIFSRIPRPIVLSLSLVCIIAVEALQYVLYVGVFDMSDILLNWTGFILGLLVARFFVDKGVMMAPRAKLPVSQQGQKL